MSTCFQYAAFGGTVVYVGVATEDLVFPHAPHIHRRELTIRASRNALPNNFSAIIQILSEGKIDLDPWMTHRLAFDEVPDQFATVIHPDSGTIKAVIEVPNP